MAPARRTACADAEPAWGRYRGSVSCFLCPIRPHQLPPFPPVAYLWGGGCGGMRMGIVHILQPDARACTLHRRMAGLGCVHVDRWHSTLRPRGTCPYGHSSLRKGPSAVPSSSSSPIARALAAPGSHVCEASAVGLTHWSLPSLAHPYMPDLATSWPNHTPCTQVFQPKFCPGPSPARKAASS